MKTFKRTLLAIAMTSGVLGSLVSSVASADPMETPSPSMSIAFKNADPAKGVWTVRKLQWDANDELGYQNFVVRMAKSKCNSVDSCFKDPVANPYYDASQEADVFYYADCGRFPYLLRMYYAWKNGLPFTAVAGKSGTEEDISEWTKDQMLQGNFFPNAARDFALNNSKNGVIMKSRITVPSTNNKSYNFFTSARSIIGSVNSANYRFDATLQMPVDPDFYPVKMDRDNIKPGTVIYDPSGHVAVVYEITATGDIRYFDSHPDNGVSHKMYNKAFLRSRPAHGAGFKNFRPFAITNAKVTGAGYSSGTLVTAQNSQLRGFSLEQFNGTIPDPAGNWAKGTFAIQGRQVDYYEYLKLALATDANAKIRPLEQLKAEIDEMCSGYQDRALDAQKAIDQGLHLQPHPETLPKNIFQADGDWENYSTPGRDFRLRSNFYDIVKSMKSYNERIKARDNLIEYSGGNFKAELLAMAKAAGESCKISYKNTRGQTVTFNLLEGFLRVNRMSFDPYFCMERRMGASTPQELASCSDDETKTRWYKAENFIRNQLVKDTTVIYGQNLEELEAENAKNPNFYRYDFLYYIDKYIQ
ncbi:hypothetical protein [Bdellovibrio sp. NC01]|uniref:hypothetical protein n=1 Tax=Bdellovibrio sp. NC01 TaxID=2220073 RepID=UPI00115B2EDB|nr:hypothetical protein [Bdellovibrio sp. NC01]